MDELYKCGYCGFLLNSQCENLLEHQCLKDIIIEGEHDLVEDDRKVLTIVEKATGDTVGSQANTSFEEQLIKYIQERPALYNLGVPLLERTYSKKMALWGEIANLFGGKYAVVDLQKKWKYLRDCYTRAKKKVLQYKPSGSEATAPPNHGFSYYELLKFIDDGASSQGTVCSVTMPPMQNPRAASPLPSTSGSNSHNVSC